MSTATADQIHEHMDVVCSQGGKLGSVDRVMGDKIKLTRKDSPDGKHHLISTSLVTKVDDKVHLSEPGDEVMKSWETV